MGFIPRRLIRENLRDVDVFLEDRDNRIFKVQDIPDTFVQGRSAFKIFGSQFLQPNVSLKIEIIDKGGNTVFTQPVKYGQISSPILKFRYISVEVYPPPYNFPGEAELIILGELDSSFEKFQRLYGSIPDIGQFDLESEYGRFLEDFQGTYNVRYRKTINIDTEKVINDQPILFYKKPRISAVELVKAQRQLDAPDNRFISGSQIYGLVNADVAGTTYPSSSEVINTQQDTFDVSQAPYGDLAVQAELYQIKTGIQEKIPFLEKFGIKEERKSPEPPQMTIFSNESKFVSKMIGGNINITGIKIPSASAFEFADVTQYEGTSHDTPENRANIYNSFSFPNFEGTVENVISDTQLTLTQPYSIEYRDANLPTGTPPQKIHSDIGDNETAIYANFTASYVDWSVPSTSSYRFDSFVDFTIDDMRTFSGDVFRMKVFGASETSLGDFPVLLDTVVTSPELLVDKVSPSGVLRSGYFQNQTHIDTYWNAFGGDNNTNTLVPYYTMSLADGLYLSGSYETFNQVGRVDLDSTYSFTVKKDVTYTLSFNAKGRRTTKNTIDGDPYQSAKIFFHLSGSELKDFSESDIQYKTSFGQVITNEFGQPIGLQVLDEEQIEHPYYKDFGKVSHTFTPKLKLDRIENTDTILQIRIHSGEWVISDLSLRPAVSTGFSPDEFKFRVPIPSNTLRPDNWKFLIQYLDINGNTSETVTFLSNFGISGSALILEGSDNLLTGSMFMGSAQGSGIEMAGANSAFVRSVGYLGYASASGVGNNAGDGTHSGFLIFSGSVLPDSGDDYKGVGLELVGHSESYFRFRTEPSELDIRADAFFVGTDDTQFISGSGGNIEISSSNFHLSSSGDVTMTGTITAEAGNIGDFQILDGQISGSNITMNATRSQIFKTDQGPGSDSSATFEQLRDEYYIDFTPSESIDTVNGYRTGFYIKMGPNFAVDKDGLLFASGAQFVGTISASAGKIGGFTIASSSLFSNNLFISGSPLVGGTHDSRNMFISTSNFNVKENGDITGSQVLFDGGTIGGFTLNSGSIFTDNVRIDSVGQVVSIGSGDDSFGSPNRIFLDAAGTGSAVYQSDWSSGTDGWIGGLVSAGNQDGITDGSTTKNNTLRLIPDVGTGLHEYKEFPTIAGETYTISITYLIGDGAGGSNSHIDGFRLAINDTSDRGAGTFDPGVTGTWTTTQIEFTTTVTRDDNQLRIYLTDGSSFTFSGGSGALDDRVYISNVTITATRQSRFSVGEELQFADHVLTVSGSDVQLITPKFFLGGGGQFVSGSEGNIEISSSNFHLERTGDVTMQGTITATAGAIGGFGISSNSISSSNDNLILKDSGQITGSSVLFSGGTIGGFTLGSSTLTGGSVTLNSGGSIKVGSLGNATTTGNTNSGFFADTDGNILIKGNTASNNFLKVTGDGGIEIKAETFDLDATKLILDSGTNNGKIALGVNPPTSVTTNKGFYADGNGNVLIGDADGNRISFDNTDLIMSASKFFLGSNSQFISGSEGNIEISSSKFHLDIEGNISMSGNIVADGGTIGGFSIASTTLTATNFILDTSNKRITLGDDSTTNILILDADDGIQLGHATFANAPFSVTKAGVLKATSGTVGGFTLSSTQITSNNLILDSAGNLETSNFASNVSGWRISSLDNGSAEFENVRIRGTLSTTVFEKETVNAVGGQLYVGNSSALTGSEVISASATTMSLVNVSGFTGSYGGDGEILSAKKVTSTGFSTEYIFVQSASRNDASSDTDFSGDIFVIRGYSGSAAGDSGSLGESPNKPQTYAPGQVFVSTGRVSTGYIRLNANPNDFTTPYMDIIERTGSNIYDIELKARLGDLSGLSSARVGASPGFGLFTEKAFLTNEVTVGTLGTEHIVVDGTSLKIKNGSTVMTELNGTTLTLGGADGSTDDSIVLSPDSGVTIFDSSTDKAVLSSLGLDVTQGGTNIARFAAITRIGDAANEHVSMSSAGFSVMDGTTQLSTFNAGGAIIGKTADAHISASSTDLNLIFDANNKAVLDSTGLILSESGAGVAQFGATTKIGKGQSEVDESFIEISGENIKLHYNEDTNPGVYATFGATTTVGSASVGHVSIDNNSVDIKRGSTTDATFGATTTIGSTSGEHVKITSTAVELKTDANTTVLSASSAGLEMQGTIRASEGEIGGFAITPTAISSSNDSLILKANGQMTASAVSMSGAISATSGNIGGFLLDDNSLTKNELLDVGSSLFVTSSIEIKTEGGGVNIPTMQIGAKSGSRGAGVLQIAKGSTSDFGAELRLGHMAGGIVRRQIWMNAFSGSNGGGAAILTDGMLYGGTSTGFILSHTDENGDQFQVGSTQGTHLRFSSQENSLFVSSSTFMLGNKDTTFLSASMGRMEISSSKFHIQPNGELTVNRVTAIEGTIGSFHINGATLHAGDPDITDTGNVYFVLGAGDDGNSKIALGAQAPDMTLTAIDGFFADGNGDFRVGRAGGVGITFDRSAKSLIMSASNFFLGDEAASVSGSEGNIQISGSNVEISTPTFMLGVSGSAGQTYISGSNGNLEISGSNFHLQPDGIINASRITLKEFASADYFAYRSKVIDAGDATERGQYFVRYQYGGTGATNNFYALILNTSRGGDSAGFVRINNADNLEYPIGMIIPPGLQNGHQVFIESGGETIHYAAGKQLSSDDLESAATNASLNSNTLSLQFGVLSNTFTSGKFHFSADGDDVANSSNFFNNSETINSVAYTNIGNQSSGNRYMWVKSLFDFRILAFQSSDDFQPNFDAGLIAGSTATFGGVVDMTAITDATDATGDTGVLRCEGGASIAKKVFVGTDLSVGGHMTGGGLRGYYFFGESNSFTATRYLDMAHEVQTNSSDAIPLIRDGSITGISTNYTVGSITMNVNSSTFSTVTLEVRINNVTKKTMTLISDATGQKNTRTTQAINTSGDTFSAGDVLQVSIDISNDNTGGTPSAVQYDDMTCYVEITYDD